MSVCCDDSHMIDKVRWLKNRNRKWERELDVYARLSLAQLVSVLSFNLCYQSSIPSEGMWLPVKTCGDFFGHHCSHFVDQEPAQRTTTMESHEPLAMKKNRRPKKASTKTQEARKQALRKGLQSPRTDTPPMKEVSWEEYKRAKKEEIIWKFIACSAQLLPLSKEIMGCRLYWAKHGCTPQL